MDLSEFFQGLVTNFSVMPEFGGSLNFLGQFARVIIEGVGIIGLGIIVFTLVLKAITLPFDIYQRYKMRKQTLIMRNMKEDLDKLQKQYANDKTTYNMKMQELYKKNGYSMFGACLPMLISLVILIVAFSGFSNYSNYANVRMYDRMAESYNERIFAYAPEGDDFLVVEKDGAFYLVDAKDETKEYPFDVLGDASLPAGIAKEGVTYSIEKEEKAAYVYDEDGTPVPDPDPENPGGTLSHTEMQPYLCVRGGEEQFLFYRYSLGGYFYTKTGEGEVRGFTPAPVADKEYKVDVSRLLPHLAEKKAEEESEEAEEDSEVDYSEVEGSATWTLAELETIVNENGGGAGGDQQMSDGVKNLVEAKCAKYVSRLGALGARDAYMEYSEKNLKFLWIKNVWETDATYKHPVSSSTFNKNVLDDTLYKDLTSELTAQTKQYNGYYILIILSIGSMLLSQFVTMRSQKESNQYQSVDGQSARTQKIMLFVMPLIYGVFAFTQSAAFSIYMIVSSLISLVVTLLCNLVLGHIFRKKEEQEIKAQYGRTVPWKQQKTQGGKQSKKRK